MNSRAAVKNILGAVARINEVVIVIACCVVASIAGLIAVQPSATENPCTPPGVTVLTDPSGDTSAALGLVSTPAPAGTDLLSLQVSQPAASDGIVRLAFTINTDPGQSPQPTGSAWYAAIKTPSGYKAVHMAWNPSAPTTPVFESYTPSTNTSGGTDGRFITQGSQVPAEPGSSYAAPFNKVVIVVNASDLGLNPGDTISGFVAGVAQSTDPGATVGAGATAFTIKCRATSRSPVRTVLDNQFVSTVGHSDPTPASTPRRTRVQRTPRLNGTTPSFSIHMSPAGMGDSWGARPSA